MERLKVTAAKVVALIGLLIAGVGVSAALATPAPNQGGNPPTVPGSPGDDCSHGKSGSECRPDPNENGKDCDDHGNARGNEDHCDQAATTTTDPTTSTTTTTTTTTTTSTTTTQTTTTPSTSTTPQTTSTNTGTTPQTTSTTPAAGTGTPPAGAGSTAAPASTPATKPELQKELAAQVKGARTARVSRAAGNPGELPFTGFPAWALALAGSLMLATGLGLRKLASDS